MINFANRLVLLTAFTTVLISCGGETEEPGGTNPTSSPKPTSGMSSTPKPTKTEEPTPGETDSPDPMSTPTMPVGTMSPKPGKTPNPGKTSTPTPSPTMTMKPTPPPMTGNVANGKLLYESADQGCVGCHGPTGGGLYKIDPAKATYSHSKESTVALSLSAYIEKWMPTDPTTKCVGDCADDIAAYIRSWSPSKGSNTIAFECKTNETSYGQRKLRLLTQSEYENSLMDLLNFRVDAAAAGVPTDSYVSKFANQTYTAVSLAHADAYASIAKQAAKFAANANFNKVTNCSGLSGDDCATKFATDFAKKVIRRPLTNEEVDRYKALFDNGVTGGDIKVGLELAVEAVLASPNFLLRSEMGVPATQNQKGNGIDADAYVLTPYEMATFLAYTYTGSTPDANLMRAADSNKLESDADIERQIDRLLSTPKAKAHFGEFAAQWLRADRVVLRPKDNAMFPNFTQDVRNAMAQEVREIFSYVMFNNEPFSELYGDFTFVNDKLANYYGMNGNFSANFTKVDNLSDRGGILTSGAFMAGFANNTESSLIQRGVAFREDMQCQLVPPMPSNLDDDRKAVAEELEQYIASKGGEISYREEVHFTTKGVACASCHEEIINPQGFGMEDFDAVGLTRTAYANNLPVDASGELIGVDTLNDGKTLAFTGAKALSKHAQTLPAIKSCFVQKGFRFVMGTGHAAFEDSHDGADHLDDKVRDGYSCSLKAMQDAMTASNDNPKAAFRALGLRDVVRYRK